MSTSNSTFRWSKADSVNIAVLDEQHQELFETVNELDESLRAGAGAAAVDAVLHKLIRYALSHFAAEEALMRQHHFPGLLTHVTQHQMFRAKIAEFLADHRAGKTGIPVALLLFMQNWLEKHVSKTDKQYSAFLNSRGVY